MARVGTVFAWLVPLIVAVELVGSAFAQSIGSTLAFLALFLGALWLPLSPEPEERKAPALWRRIAGGVLLLAGAAVLVFGVWRILEPARFPPATLPEWLRKYEWSVLVPVLACWPTALGIPWLLGKRLGARDMERAGLFIALVFLALLHAKTKVQGLFVLPYAKPWLPTLLGSIAALVVVLAFVPKLPPLMRFTALVACALVLRAAGLDTWKLDPATRDMLPLVQSAQDAWLAGENPYQIHTMQRGSQVPLTYLPGMWLLHGIPRLFGQDIRFAGILADLAVVASLWWASSGVAERYRERAQALVLAFSAAWLFSPSVHWNGLYAEPHAWWLVLAPLIASVVCRRYWLAAGLLGLALATRHFSLVVAPFVVIAIWRAVGWRGALARLGLTGAIAAVLLVPFAMRDPETFWFGTYRWLVEYGPAHQSWFWFKFGFSGPLYKANATEWMPRAQIAIVALMSVVALVLRGPRAFVAPAGTAYVGFVMFNGIIWDSFYLGASLFPAFAVAAGHPRAAEPAAEPKPIHKYVFATCIALLVVSTTAGSMLVASLVASRDRRGIGEVRDELAKVAQPGDAIVDRSDFRLAFVKGDPLFEGAPPTPRVGLGVFDPRFGQNGAFDAQELVVVTRSKRDEVLRSKLRALGDANTRTIGRFDLTNVPLSPIRGRLSQHVEALAPSFSGKELPRAGNRWVSPEVTYVEVTPRTCRIGGAMRPMLFAHPATGGELRLTFRQLDLGKKLILFAGIEDSAVVWGRAPVSLSLSIDGKPVAELPIKNAIGPDWTAIDTAAGKHDIEIVLTTKDDAQRFVCVDALLLD